MASEFVSSWATKPLRKWTIFWNFQSGSIFYYKEFFSIDRYLSLLLQSPIKARTTDYETFYINFTLVNKNIITIDAILEQALKPGCTSRDLVLARTDWFHFVAFFTVMLAWSEFKMSSKHSMQLFRTSSIQSPNPTFPSTIYYYHCDSKA